MIDLTASVTHSVDTFSVLNDPIHGVMGFSGALRAVLKDIIDHDTFQRLRHIKQLGMTDLVFPSAVHTRFNHCLGACYVANQMAEHLDLDDLQKKHVLAATLLHDIGHGPFSHAFERFLVDPSGELVRHERWTPYFLNDFESVFKEHQIDRARLEALISSKDYHTRSLEASIVSSQLDADRLDYLLRDSHFCGVLYGKADIQWILKHLTVVQDPKTGRDAMGVRRKGWRAVEHFLLCRRMMTYNVYRHPKKEVIEATLTFLLHYLTKAWMEERPLIEKSGLFINKTLSHFLEKAHALRQGDLDAQAFLTQAFPTYKVLTDVDLWMQLRDLATLSTHTVHEIPKQSALYNCIEMSKRLYDRKLARYHPLRKGDESVVQEIVEHAIRKGDIAHWQLFPFKTQVKAYENNPPLLIIDESGSVDSISTYSVLLQHLSGLNDEDHYLAIDPTLNPLNYPTLYEAIRPHIIAKDTPNLE